MDNNPSTSNPLTTDSIPTTMRPGAVLHTTLNERPVVLVGTTPAGYTAILCPEGWRILERWKLTRLRTSTGKVRACGTGRNAGFVADRLLLNAATNHVVFHRNGNLLDLRLCNLVAIPQGLLRQAEIENARPANYGADVVLRDGRMRSCRKPLSPSAGERIAALMAGHEAQQQLP